MKKIAQILTALMLSTAAMSGVAAAQDNSCNLGNTGPSSINSCTFNNTDTVTVNCTNNVTITNTNGQVSTSGAANNSGNTNSGTAVSGDASNLNVVVNELAAICGQVAAASTPPVGGGSEKKEETPAKPQVKATPEGAVSAGAGGAAESTDAWAVAGVVGAVATVAGGYVAVRKFAL